MPPVHVVITTHTPRHLGPCLAALARQSRPPRTVVLTCDSDDPEIARTAEDAWRRAGPRLNPTPLFVLTRRRSQGQARVSQTRNNGLRALDRVAPPRDSDLVIWLDGDMLLGESGVERHAALAAAGAEFIPAFRVCLEPGPTAAITVDSVLGDGPTAIPSLEAMARERDLDELRARQRRYERQLRVRRLRPLGLPFVKPHKPKAIACHFSVTVGRLREINGFDEEFVGYASEDDDLSRRLHALRPRIRTAIAVESILAFHLWHPTRATARPKEEAAYGRFAAGGLPIRTVHGWENPLPQDEPDDQVLSGSRLSAPELSATTASTRREPKPTD